MKVPFSALGAQYRRHKVELDAAVQRVLESGFYIGGPEVEEFERAFAADCGAGQCIGVANGTDALALALRAAGVKRGDEVIVPAVSAYPTTAAVVQAEAVPVFVDVRLEDGLIDVELVDQSITPLTRAIVPVHLYGSMCAMEELAKISLRRAIPIVEDCAQAHGARLGERPAGSYSLAAAFSFYPTKNLGAYGDAGAMTTGSVEAADKLRRLRNYGQRNRYEHVEPGVNSRLDPLQAALLAVKLRSLPADNARRRALAERYEAGLRGLEGLSLLQIAGGSTPSRHLFVVRLRDIPREAFQRALAEQGVETLVHYPIAMPDQAATDPSWRARSQCPNARAFCASVISLPLYPELTEEQIDYTVAAVRSTLASREWWRAGLGS